MFAHLSAVDPATPLAEVTFCVVDLETTGGSPHDDAMTEIGAVLVRGGEALGTFQTFVHPGRSIPARITYLTGISDAMVVDAPRPEAVLAMFLEFARNAVIVGHNVRFDLSFLNPALVRAGHPAYVGPSIDTCALARRLVRDEVPDCRLGTLADWLRLDHRPTHRALTDALATTDLLHHLLERVSSYAVFRLDDLLALPRLAGHPHAAKLRLTDALPRTPGVYEFVDRDGQVIYVGKATNLRQRVRSYFGNDDRRTIRPMLAALHGIRFRPAPHALPAEIAELRLLHAARPRFNRAGALPTRCTWLGLTDEAFPRFVTSAKPLALDRSLGPFPSLALARRAQEAIETLVPIRRCTGRPKPGRCDRAEPCGPAQLGVASCPCAGSISELGYRPIAQAARRSLTVDADGIVRGLEVRMHTLAASLRFEEAALTRDRLAALRSAHRDRAVHRVFVDAGRLELRLGPTALVIDHGLLVSAHVGGEAMELPPSLAAAPDPSAGIDPARLAEARLIARWLLRRPEQWTTDDPAVRLALLTALAPPDERRGLSGAASIPPDGEPEARAAA